jgi:hypothetical protein
MIGIDPGDFTPEALVKIAPGCGECAAPSGVELVKSEAIYPNRSDLWTHDDGATRYYWRCRDCGAYVGVHRGTFKALGTPAGKATRDARSAAHAAFDPLWQKRAHISAMKPSRARAKGYRWLASELGIDPKECHIGMMDVAMARRVVEICRRP